MKKKVNFLKCKKDINFKLFCSKKQKIEKKPVMKKLGERIGKFYHRE